MTERALPETAENILGPKKCSKKIDFNDFERLEEIKIDYASLHDNLVPFDRKWSSIRFGPENVSGENRAMGPDRMHFTIFMNVCLRSYSSGD